MKPRCHFITAKLLITVCASLLYFPLAMAEGQATPAAAVSSVSTPPLPTDEIQEFVTAITAIKHYYINETSDQTLFNNAINGMLTHLDPHSSFMNTEDLKQLDTTVTGKFVGIGVELTVENGALKVISPLEGTPADKAGLQTNDLIIKVDDSLVENMSLNEAINKIKGKKGTQVELTILRKNTDAPLQIKITRDTIKIVTVKSKLLENHYGYVRITFFQGHADKELIDAIKAIKKESNNQLYGLVLDLRNNPGGLLNLSAEITDLFLDQQTTQAYDNLIVYTKGRIPGSDITIKAKPNDLIPGVPLVVLINGGSASASEIVAGALQDYNRAVIMGSRSFGKGSVQTIIPVSDNSAIKLTTALYYTPAGRAIQAEGIVPDIHIPPLEIKKQDDAFYLSESDFSHHLKNGDNKDKEQNKIHKNMLTEELNLAQEDYQLFSALIMLKGLHVAH